VAGAPRHDRNSHRSRSVLCVSTHVHLLPALCRIQSQHTRLLHAQLLHIQLLCILRQQLRILWRCVGPLRTLLRILIRGLLAWTSTLHLAMAVCAD
jgi:hypothetical protein